MKVMTDAAMVHSEPIKRFVLNQSISDTSFPIQLRCQYRVVTQQRPYFPFSRAVRLSLYWTIVLVNLATELGGIV